VAVCLNTLLFFFSFYTQIFSLQKCNSSQRKLISLTAHCLSYSAISILLLLLRISSACSSEVRKKSPKTEFYMEKLSNTDNLEDNIKIYSKMNGHVLEFGLDLTFQPN
jgi:hypothetical protein